MPTVNMSIGNTSQSFVRPVVVEIVEQVKSALKIAKEVPIFYGGEMGIQQAAGTGVGNEEDRRARMDTLRRLTITADEVYAEDQNITDVVGRRNSIPVFVDTELGVEVRPVYTTSTMSISFKYETKSKEECLRWRQEATMKYMMLRTSLMHQISYSYSLPVPIWALIKNIWECREAAAGYEQDFGHYLRLCMQNRLTVIGNENGNQAQFQVTEKQDRIQGFFDFTADPKKAEYDEARGNWSIEFIYSFTYQRPVGVDVLYPITVHNQFLDPKFVQFEKGVDIHDRFFMDLTTWSLAQYEGKAFLSIAKPEVPYVRIPMEDDFNITGTFPGTGTFALVLMLLEKDAETPGFNLGDMGDVCLDPDILEFIQKEEYQYIGKLGKSIFHFEVYKNSMPLTAPSVSVDKDLNLKLLINPDLRKQYRVRLALFSDLAFIDRKALDRLRNYPKAFVKIFGAINELLLYRSDFQNLGEQNVIHPWQLTRAFEAVSGSPITNGYQGYSQGGNRGFRDDFLAIPQNVREYYFRTKKTMKTVMYQSLVTHKKD